MIQNADDAGATRIAFILDTRSLETKRTFCADFNRLQKPALLCWNNATFSQADLDGIIDLGKGSKRDSAMKIGRFGVGFNSVYHITDAPQIISNAADYVIFDPLCAHLDNLDKSNPGLHIDNCGRYFDETTGGGIFRDVLSGFEVPEFELTGATMFRLALRTVRTNISELTFDCFKIRATIDKFLNENDDFLMFLKNVCKKLI